MFQSWKIIEYRGTRVIEHMDRNANIWHIQTYLRICMCSGEVHGQGLDEQNS